MKKSTLLAALWILLVSAAPFGATAVAAADSGKITFRAATTVQPAMPSGKAVEEFCNTVNKLSSGRITVEYYPANQLAKADEMMAQLIDGTLDIGQVSIASASSYCTQIECVQLPFLLNDYTKMAKAYRSKEMHDILGVLEKELGVKVLTMAEHGLRIVANNVRPVNVPDDLKGIKMRAAQNAVNFEAIKALGGNPVGVPYNELYSALESKVLDGEEINYTSIYAEKHYEVLKYVSNVPLWSYPAVLVMSGEAWNSLSDADKKLVEEAAETSLEKNFEYLKEYEAMAVKALTDAGVKINDVPDLQPFKDKVHYLKEKYAKSDPLVKAFIEMADKL